MKTKRIISLLIALAMVFSLCMTATMAAGSDYVVGITVEKNNDARISVGVNVGPSGDSAFIQAVQTFIVAYDTEVFYPLMKNGTTAVTGITTSPVVKNMSHTLYEDPDSCAEWATKTYPYNSADGKTGFVLIQPAEGDYGSTLTETVTLAKIYLGFQAGKGYADVKADTVRFATAAELAGMSEDKAVKINSGSGAYYWSNGGSGDSLPAGTVTASGFEFATDKPAVTTVEAPAADATAFVYNGTAQTYAIAANDAYTVTGATQTNAGTYTVTVALNDTTAYVWADGTTDAKTYNFVIAPKSIAGAVVADVDDVVYTGSAFEPTPAVTVDGVDLVAGADFDYAYENNTAIGTATVKVVAKGNYTGEASTTFVIADDYTAMKYAAGYSYKIENGTLYVKGADATIYVIEAKYEGAKMTSCVLKPVVITGGAANVAVDTTATLFIWDANMQAMN